MRRLLRREPVLDQLVFDAFVRERARGVEAERLEIAGQHLHGGDAAGLDRLDELGARRERKIRPAPQAEPLGIGEIVDRGGARRRDIEHAGVGQARAAGAGRRGPAATAPDRRARSCRRRRSAWRGSRRTRSRRRSRGRASRRSAARARPSPRARPSAASRRW